MGSRQCVKCGAGISGRGRRLYCSDDCALIERECRTCGDVFKVERKRRDRNFVCSLACRPTRQWGRERVEVECGHCGDPFAVYPSQIEEGRGKFCSRNCAALARPITRRSKIADAAIDAFLAGHPELCEMEKRVDRWSIDLAFPMEMIAVELDGEYWHSLPEMVEKDRRKDARLAELGWTVRRVPIRRHDQAHEIAARIAEEVSSCRQTI